MQFFGGEILFGGGYKIYLYNLRTMSVLTTIIGGFPNHNLHNTDEVFYL
jgi:hypothetical protein